MEEICNILCDSDADCRGVEYAAGFVYEMHKNDKMQYTEDYISNMCRNSAV